MFDVRQTDVFAEWLIGLRDAKAKARIIARIVSARLGNLGDAKSVAGEICEMRVHVGAGYRVYFVRRGATLIVLLCGGDKSSQARDIARARKLVAELDRD